jgi:hypothetical protein
MDLSKSGKVHSNYLTDSIHLRDTDYTYFLYCKHGEFIEFFMQYPAVSEQMSYAPSSKFNIAEALIYSEGKSSDW